MKIYMLYIKIPVKDFTKRVRDLLPNLKDYREKGDYYTGLYAWTEKKSLLKEFFKVRNKDKYIVIKHEIDEDLYTKFCVYNKEYQIGYYSFYDELKLGEDTENKHEAEKHILSVFHENKEVMFEGEAMFYDEFYETTSYDYHFFKEKYRECLEILGYSSLYDQCGISTKFDDDDEIDDRTEYADYQASFGLTLEGHKLLNLVDDRLTIFLKNYHFAF